MNHYRKVFKSDHLSSADLEDFIEAKKPLIFTIKEVKQYVLTSDKNSGVVVAGKRIGSNIAFFVEDIKPMVLNATNCLVLKNLTNTPFIEQWKNITVELYVQRNIKFGKDVVEGVRIKDNPIVALSDKEIAIIESKIIASTTEQQLKDIYNSDVRIKTNKGILEALTLRKESLV